MDQTESNTVSKKNCWSAILWGMTTTAALTSGTLLYAFSLASSDDVTVDLTDKQELAIKNGLVSFSIEDLRQETRKMIDNKFKSEIPNLEAH